MLPKILFDLFFCDPVARHDLGVFDSKRHHRRSAAKAPHIKMAHAVMHCYHFGERRQRLLAAIAGGVHRQESIDPTGGHCALLGLESHLDVIRLPGAFLLVLSETHGVLAGPAKSRTVSFAGKSSTHGDEYQANRAPDGCIRSIARAEYPGVTVDVKLLS